jgi:hypothetical protein
MAYTFEWPSSLPQHPDAGFTETMGSLILRTPMDGGPAKERKRGNSPGKMTVQYLMTTAQVETLGLFVDETLDSTSRFGWKHPRTLQMVEVRIIPQGGGDLYTVQYRAPGYWTVNLQLETLP